MIAITNNHLKMMKISSAGRFLRQSTSRSNNNNQKRRMIPTIRKIYPFPTLYIIMIIIIIIIPSRQREYDGIRMTLEVTISGRLDFGVT